MSYKKTNVSLTNFNSVNELVELDGSAKLPAVDGSQLINLPGGGGLSATQITVFPTNTSAFPGYGVQQFGTDLNAAWASIPRSDDSFLQHCNNWVVLIPANTYVPASNNLSIIGTINTTYSGYGVDTRNYITDFGYNLSAPIVGQTITGPGIPANTTISAVGVLSGSGFQSPVGFVQGSNVITVPSTANYFIGQTIQKEGTIPGCYVTSITDATHIVVSDYALVTNASSSMTPIASVYVQLSNTPTIPNRNVNFSVNVPLKFIGTTNSNTSLTAVSYVAADMIGLTITGQDIPSSTTITAISYNSTTNLGTITLSQSATGSTVGSTYSIQLPSKFYCDMSRRRIVNMCLGPVELGKMYRSYPGAQGATGIGASAFWTPQPGTDHFIDLHLQASTMFYLGGVRPGWSWSSLTNHEEANNTHEAYRTKSRLSGTLKLLDQPFVAASSWNIADMEIFGNPGLMTYSQQTGTTHGTNVLDGLTSTTGLMTGQKISGTGIPSDTYIQSITSSSALVMTKVATNSASNTMTFAYALPSTVSIDGSLINNILGMYTSIYKCRIRGSIIGNYQNAASVYHLELANLEDTEFSGFINVTGYDKIRTCAFKAGMFWNINTTNFDNYGFYDCQFSSTAAFNAGATSAPLRVDSSTNYWLKVAPSTLGANTVKLVMSDITSSAVNLTAQAAAIGSTTLFTPASDGMYRINVYASCTTSAVGDGTIAPTIGWKDDTTTQSLAASPLLLTTQGSYSTLDVVVKCKSGNAITYLTTLVGAQTTSQYSLYVNVENIT
jgi:hypothetical protein